MSRFRRPAAAVLLALLPVIALGCGRPSEQAQEEVRVEIEIALADYLPRLAEVYRTGDLSPLVGLAAPREIASVESFISERAQEGRVVDAELQRFEIQDFDLYKYNSAFVTTREVWDLHLRAAGSDRLLSEELGRAYRYRYQFYRDDGEGWKIRSRVVVEPPA